MKKIVIIGSPGSGKSTFARALGKVLNIEVLHLDRYFWQPGWKEHPRNTRIEIQQQLVQGKDCWIIEGTYLSSSVSRLHAADTIIFLDMPCLLCLQQAIWRYFTYQGCARPDLPDGCTDRLRALYLLKILVFPYKGRKLFLKKAKEIHELEVNAAEKKTFHTFRSHKDLAEFLQSLSAQQQVEHLLESERDMPDPFAGKRMSFMPSGA